MSLLKALLARLSARWLAICLLALLLVGWALREAHRANTLASAAAASASREFAARAAAAGWQVKAGSEADLAKRLAQSRDSLERALIAAAKATGSRPIERTIITTTAVDTVEVPVPAEATADTLAHLVCDRTLTPGPFRIALSSPTPVLCRIVPSVASAASIIHTVTPDRRLVVSVRSLTPGVSVVADSFVYDLPELKPPPSRLRWFAIGAGVGALACLLLRC